MNVKIDKCNLDLKPKLIAFLIDYMSVCFKYNLYISSRDSKITSANNPEEIIENITHLCESVGIDPNEFFLVVERVLEKLGIPLK